ncbi:hypothetical protein N9I12_03150 [Gammaproteobacteria bacterium]|nr:hypothetical protein [Gammaproteobacteria bacterium]
MQLFYSYCYSFNEGGYLKEIEEFKKYCNKKTSGRLNNLAITALIPKKLTSNRMKYTPEKYPRIITKTNEMSLRKTLSDFLKLYNEFRAKLNKAAEDTEIAFEKKISCCKIL